MIAYNFRYDDGTDLRFEVDEEGDSSSESVDLPEVFNAFLFVSLGFRVFSLSACYTDSPGLSGRIVGKSKLGAPDSGEAIEPEEVQIVRTTLRRFL